MDSTITSPSTSAAAAMPVTPRFNKIWADLTAPAVGLSLSQQQRARLLASVTFVLMPVAGFAIFSVPITNFLRNGTLTAPLVPPLIAWVLIFIAYVLSRTIYYRWGALVVIGVPFIATVGIAFTSSGLVTNPTIFFFMSLSITLASLLLTARDTVITGVIAVVLIAVVSGAKAATGTIDAAAMSFAMIITVTSSLVSSIRDRNLQSLEISQRELQEQVIETRQARERAEQSDKVKSAFLASMSHELRTPMNAIINFTRYVAKGSLGAVNEEQAETLGEVVDSAKHLLNLINDVLDMSKIEAGSLNLFVEDNIELHSILDNVMSVGKSLTVEKSVELRLEAPDDLPTLRGDRQRILQILLNIMSNACKFTDSGTITLRARRVGSEVELSIQDTGGGIAPEDQADVFQPFKQTTSGLRRGGGTGLGMPISKNLAEAHGGRLWLESEINKGSTFTVALPIKSETLTLSVA